MAALTGQSIASSYEQILHVDRDGGGNSTTLVSIKDGDNGSTFGFQISTNALMMTSTNQLQFGDTGTYIHQSADGVLDLVSDTELELNADTIDINGAVEVSGHTIIESTSQLRFGDTGTYIHQSADGVLDLVSDTEIEINATTIDINGAVDISGNIVAQSGINFPDTQAASADANTLDDYEEGSWTPALAQGGNSVTLSTAVGRYTKIGNTVNFNFYIGASNLGSASGALTLSGLPFTTSNIANNFHAYSAGYGANLNITANAHIAGYSNRNDTTIYLNTWNATGGVSDFTAAMLSADGQFMMAGHFSID